MQQALEKHLVYVVDDDEAVRESTRMVLESYGMRVKTYRSGPAFLAEAGYGPSGCLLVDQHMPGMTGLELLERMRSQRMAMPTIMVTGRNDASLKERALRSGVVKLLDKPVADDDLIRAIDAVMNPA